MRKPLKYYISAQKKTPLIRDGLTREQFNRAIASINLKLGREVVFATGECDEVWFAETNETPVAAFLPISDLWSFDDNPDYEG